VHLHVFAPCSATEWGSLWTAAGPLIWLRCFLPPCPQRQSPASCLHWLSGPRPHAAWGLTSHTLTAFQKLCTTFFHQVGPQPRQIYNRLSARRLSSSRSATTTAGSSAYQVQAVYNLMPTAAPCQNTGTMRQPGETRRYTASTAASNVAKHCHYSIALVMARPNATCTSKAQNTNQRLATSCRKVKNNNNNNTKADQLQLDGIHESTTLMTRRTH
jgi:hypothetical protein